MPGWIRARIAAGESLGCLWLHLGSPSVAEIAAEAGPDAVVFDLQHGLWDRLTLEAGIGLVRHRTSPLVRVARNSALEIGSALDAGAVGVIVPLVETAAQAAEAVAAARFPPDGARSGGGIRPLQRFTPYVAEARAHTFVAVMIETADGVANAAAIAATPGLDMVFIGTGDLSISLGLFPGGGPALETAIEAIKAGCAAAGTACGIFTLYASMARERRRQGFALTVLGDDGLLIGGALRSAVSGFGPTQPPGFDWAATTAFVTGTSRGIGRALVQRLLAAGCPKIYCAARDPAHIQDLIATAPDRLHPIALDITDLAAVTAAAAAAPDTTLLINNAGINFNQAFTAPDVLERAHTEMDTNYLGPLRTIRAFAPILGRNGGGAVVNILSLLAEISLPAMGPLCASKAAALSFTQAARAHLRAQGTHVLAVLPGAVDTDMSRGLDAPKMPAVSVADAVIDGLERGLEEIYPGDMAAGVAFGRVMDAKGVEREFAGYLNPAETW